jgi:hypothetical protein
VRNKYRTPEPVTAGSLEEDTEAAPTTVSQGYTLVGKERRAIKAATKEAAHMATVAVERPVGVPATTENGLPEVKIIKKYVGLPLGQ